MTEEQLKIIKDFTEQIIKDTSVVVKNSAERTNSKLIADIQTTHTELKDGITGITKRLDILNGSVAKQQDKLSQHDIINAQTTITQQQIINTLETLKKSDDENTKYITETRAVISVFKWLVGFIGIGNLAVVIKYIIIPLVKTI